jgi:steroid delta-isomerase-like uncharacterized protein
MAWYDEYGEAWNRRDADEIVSFMTDDAVYEDVATGAHSRGHDEIKAFIQGMSERVSSDIAFEFPDPIVVTEDGYALEWIMRGTHDRGSDQLPGSRKPFEIHGVSVGRLDGGKIAWNRDYWSMGEFLVQIGLLPPISAAPASH